jgi:hypothetical protein
LLLRITVKYENIVSESDPDRFIRNAREINYDQKQMY